MINMHEIGEMKISEFADKHDLVMEVHERELPKNHPARFYAHFQNTEVKDGCCLVGTFGDGDCPEQAIKEYAKEIELHTLIVNAYGPDRREIKVPRLTGD